MRIRFFNFPIWVAVAISTGILLRTPSASGADASAAAVPTLDEIVTELRVRLAGLDSLSYSTLCFEADSKAFSAKLDFRERGEKCWLRFREWNRDRAPDFTSWYSFDGRRAMRMVDEAGTVFVSGKPMDFTPEIQNMQFITSPFDFLVNVDGINPWQSPNLALLKSDSTWKSFARRSRVLGAEARGGRECVVLRVDGGRPRFFKDMPTYFIVHLDPKMGYAPVAWRQFDRKDRLVSELEVQESARATWPGSGAFSLPARLKVAFYAIDETGGPRFYDKPTNFQYFEYRDVSMDTLPNSRFVLDMSDAGFVQDNDTHTMFAAPAISAIDSN